MIDKKKQNQLINSLKIGAVVAYKNLETNERYIDIAPDLAGVKIVLNLLKRLGLVCLMPLKKQQKRLILN